ncbi:MAG: hypothetical protein WB421_07865 [Terriglobales bacterium]
MIGHFVRNAAHALCAVVLVVASASPVSAKDKTSLPTLVWAADKPGCSFSRGEDGKYRYDLKADNLEITLAVDSREVQEIRRRPVPVLGVFATFHYQGQKSMDINPDKLTLEFLLHSKVVQNALQLGGLAARLQKDIDEITDQTEHEVRKHPEKKEELEAALRVHLQELSAMTEFVNAHSLRPGTLTPAEPEMSGWIFFDTTNKWIGSWKKREEFLLRVPFKDRVFEFPFSLPPTEGDLILRRRPE